MRAEMRIVMEIVAYNSRYAKDFAALNTAWIEQFFEHLEEEDIHTFQNVEQEISAGGMIYFCLEEGEVMATCMTRKIDSRTWEICKLAASERYKGRGAGNAVFKKCMEYAIMHGAKRLFILSNSRLKTALHIYQKYGFREIKLDNYEYERGDIAFEFIVD